MSPVIYVSPAFRTACAEPRGARLLILREQNGWCHVRTRTACGWVSKTDIVLFYCRPAL